MPRPQPVVDMLLAQDRGDPFDQAAFDATPTDPTKMPMAAAVIRDWKREADLKSKADCGCS